MMRSLASVVMLGAVLHGAGGLAGAAAGDLLWHDEFNPDGGQDSAQAVAVGHGRVVTVGRVENAAGDTDFVVRVHAAAGGALLWSDRLDVAGADDQASAVALDDDRVIVAGTSVDATGAGQLLLRAYALRTGRLRWDRRVAVAAVNGLVVDGSRVVIVGTTRDASGLSAPLVRVYVARTGALLWEDRSVPAGWETLVGSTKAGVAVHGRTAFVAGTIRRPVGDPDVTAHCLVRAFDVRTGRRLWETIQTTACAARALATDGRRVLVAAQGGSAILDDFLIQSYDAETGAFLWEDRTFVGTGFDNAAIAVDTTRRRAFVAGWVRWLPGTQNQEAFLVRSYDSETGVLRWEDQYPSPRHCLCHARDLVVAGGSVFAIGQAAPVSGVGTWIVRTYDARDGDLLWAEEFAPVGGVGPAFGAQGALAAAVGGGRLYVAGTGINAADNADFIVRAYDAR
jgi:PQQ-like domain